MAGQLGLWSMNKVAPDMLQQIDEANKHDSALGAKEKSRYVDSVQAWEERFQPNQPGLYSDELRAGLRKKENTAPKATLMTSRPDKAKKRIYGLGKSTGKEKPASVQKPKLGGN